MPMPSIAEVKVRMGELLVKEFGEDFVDMEQQNIDVKNLELEKLENKKKALEAELAALKAAKEKVEDIQPATPVVAPTLVEEPKPVQQVQPTPVVEESVKEVEAKPVAEEIQSLEKEIEDAQATLKTAKEEAAKKELVDLAKSKIINLLKQTQESFSNRQILEAITACAAIPEKVEALEKSLTVNMQDMLADPKYKDEIIQVINKFYDIIVEAVPVFGLIKFPLDINGLIARLETVKTIEDARAVIDNFRQMFDSLDIFNQDKIALAVAQHEWTKEELELLGTTKEDLQKEAKELQAAIELETPILVEEGISRLMFAYPGALRAEHNHLSPTNTVFTAQNSSGQQLTIVPLLDDNKQLTRVKIALSPIELFKDGTVVPFTFASQHHEQEFTFNAKVMAAITAFITNNGGFRTNTNDTSIELEDVKK